MHCDLSSWLGTFKTAKEAAKACDSATKKISEPSAKYNSDDICFQETEAHAKKLGNKRTNGMDQRASTASGKGMPDKVLREAREAVEESSGEKMSPIDYKLLQVIIDPFLFND